MHLEQKTEELSGLLKQFSHPKKLLILCKLGSWAKTVGELEKNCIISQSQLSQFLKKMKDEGIVDSEKNGQFVSYHISDPKIQQLMKSLESIFCNQ
jgi:DNA-binding transcriptional ArsR family regulator